MDPEAQRTQNMAYLQLDAAQYDQHRVYMAQKMNEWPADLWEFVWRVQHRYGMCGEVISSAVADWVRGSGAMTGMDPIPAMVPAAV